MFWNMAHMVDPAVVAAGGVSFTDMLVGLTVAEHRELTIVRTILDVWLHSNTVNNSTNGRFAVAIVSGDAFSGSVMPDPLSDDTDYMVNQGFFQEESQFNENWLHFHLDLKGQRAQHQDDWMLSFIIEVHASADASAQFFHTARTLLKRR